MSTNTFTKEQIDQMVGNSFMRFGDVINRIVISRSIPADKTLLNIDYFRVGMHYNDIQSNTEKKREILDWLQENSHKIDFLGCRFKQKANTLYFRFASKSIASMFMLKFGGSAK